MAVTNGYCALDTLKLRLDISSDTTTHDERLSNIINAVSRAIDYTCGGRRHFYTTASQARTFTAQDSKILFVDDLQSIDTDGLVTDDDGDRTYENTWETTDYILLPENANTDGKPYTMIEVDPFGSYTFPAGVRRGVQITGTWGYCASTSVPPGIKDACLLAGEQLWSRKDAIFGVIGVPGGEALMSLASDILLKDPHLRMMIEPFRRLV